MDLDELDLSGMEGTGNPVYVLVTSDTHTENKNEVHGLFDGLVDEVDLIVHAGDFTDIAVLNYFDEPGFRGVYGNSDPPELSEKLDRRVCFEVSGIRFLVLHGHRIGSNQELGYLAAQENADVLIRGHSHRPRAVERNALLINPGSPTRPRGGYPPSFAVLEVPENPSGYVDLSGGIYRLDGEPITPI
ncbi:MAG: YfcE family phosphodiesterase [Halobacteria archaeon]